MITLTSKELSTHTQQYKIAGVVVSRSLADSLIEKLHQPVSVVVTSLVIQGKPEDEVSVLAEVTAKTIVKTLTASIMQSVHNSHCVDE